MPPPSRLRIRIECSFDIFEKGVEGERLYNLYKNSVCFSYRQKARRFLREKPAYCGQAGALRHIGAHKKNATRFRLYSFFIASLRQRLIARPSSIASEPIQTRLMPGNRIASRTI